MYQDPPEHWPNLTKFHRRLGVLLDLPLPLDERGELTPNMLELSPEAKAIWVDFHDEVEKELRPGRDLVEAKDVASKLIIVHGWPHCFHLFENAPCGTTLLATCRPRQRLLLGIYTKPGDLWRRLPYRLN